MNRNKVPLEQRFWSKVNKVGENGCWEWTASKDKDGYGQINYMGTMKSAHRISWQLSYGNIPKNMQVCHHCDNPSCVNPKHLFLGTNGDNQRDAFKKGRKSLKGEHHPQSRLTKEDVIEIRAIYATGRYTYEQIANKFNMSASHIWRIITKKHWSHI